MEENILTNPIEETTDTELVEQNTETAEVATEQTEEKAENKAVEKAEKVEPLEEQKPFLMSPYERAIHEEMERRATDNPALAEGLKDKDKNIGECYAFVTNRAKKMAEGNCAMIADSEVYAWAQFYYTQRREIIELELEKPAPKPTIPTTTATTAKAKGKAKTETKPKTEDKPKAEEKPTDKNIEVVKGVDGKEHTITNLSLF